MRLPDIKITTDADGSWIIQNRSDKIVVYWAEKPYVGTFKYNLKARQPEFPLLKLYTGKDNFIFASNDHSKNEKLVFMTTAVDIDSTKTCLQNSRNFITEMELCD